MFRPPKQPQVFVSLSPKQGVAECLNFYTQLATKTAPNFATAIVKKLIH